MYTLHIITLIELPELVFGKAVVDGLTAVEFTAVYTPENKRKLLHTNAYSIHCDMLQSNHGFIYSSYTKPT